MIMKKRISTSKILLEQPIGLSLSTFSAFSLLHLFPVAILCIMALSCTRMAETASAAGPTDLRIRMNAGGFPAENHYADVFVFNDDALARLDSYQRFIFDRDTQVDAVGTAGGRIVVAVVSPDADKYSWAAMNSYSALLGRETDLRDEDPSLPVLSGMTSVGEDSREECSIVLRPLLAKVTLRSLSCDFSGRTYSGERLRNVRVYLTNVSSRCRILGDDTFPTTSVMNAGGLSLSDLESLRCPGMLMREIRGDVGWDVVRTDIDLYCYPNTNEVQSAGTPFTRLVIEGEVGGKTWYWPLDVNRGDFGPVHGRPGVSRDCSYVFDVSLFRLGSEDPDTPVSLADVSLDCAVVPWTEIPEISEPF